MQATPRNIRKQLSQKSHKRSSKMKFSIEIQQKVIVNHAKNVNCTSRTHSTPSQCESCVIFPIECKMPRLSVGISIYTDRLTNLCENGAINSIFLVLRE